MKRLFEKLASQLQRMRSKWRFGDRDAHSATRAGTAPRSDGEPEAPQRPIEFTLREYTDGNVFFVVGPARSGTSATIRALSTGSNVDCYEQKKPRFIRYVRDYELGLFDDVESLVLKHRWPDMRATLSAGRIYGEKDQQVYPWISRYWRLFGGRYINVVRDGREAVRSLMEFYTSVNGLLYLEASDPVELPDDVLSAQRAALASSAAKELEENRPRPIVQSDVFGNWESIPRLGMVAWHWSHSIRNADRELRKVPLTRQRRIDFTHGPRLADIEELFSFLGIDGFDRQELAELIEARPNSITSKIKGNKEPYPVWQNWSPENTATFDRYASAAMVENGFYPIDRYPFPTTAAHYAKSSTEIARCQVPSGVAPSIMQQLERRFPGIFRSTCLVLTPNQETATAVESVPAAHCDRRIWPGGSFGAMPTTAAATVCCFGLLEASLDVPRTLKQIAELAQQNLVVINLCAPFLDSIETRHGNLRSTERLPNQVSLSSTMSLLERSLGFSNVELCSLEASWALNPRPQAVIAQRAQTSEIAG